MGVRHAHLLVHGHQVIFTPALSFSGPMQTHPIHSLGEHVVPHDAFTAHQVHMRHTRTGVVNKLNCHCTGQAFTGFFPHQKV